jgi:UDP-glucose 4-epimerase
MKTHHYGVVNWFIRLAIDGRTIKVFGDGQLKRDFLYIEDCIDALVMSATNKKAYGEIFNVGIDKPTTFLELAKLIIEKSKSGKWEFAPFSPERLAQEPGDFYSDITKIKTIIGWQSKTDLGEGIQKTIDFYQKNRRHYW